MPASATQGGHNYTVHGTNSALRWLMASTSFLQICELANRSFVTRLYKWLWCKQSIRC